jgi:hypothetical protein
MVVVKRLLLVAFVIGACAFCAVGAEALTVTAQLYPFTGEIQLRNTTAAPFPFTFYSIESDSGALNSSSLIWKSISDNYDVSGNGFIDPLNNWNKLSSVGSTTELSEAVVPVPGGILPAMRAISLGNVWDPLEVPAPDLEFTVIDSNNQPANVIVQLAVAGDYSGNGIVDAGDYVAWRNTFGSSSQLQADGNLNGVIDAGDYSIWRNNFGRSVLGFGSALGSSNGRSQMLGSVVPEPNVAALLLFSATPVLSWACRRFGR